MRGEAIATYVPGFWSWKDSNWTSLTILTKGLVFLVWSAHRSKGRCRLSRVLSRDSGVFVSGGSATT